jgi:formylglycine-generating enzyme required for sulfatase activity
MSKTRQRRLNRRALLLGSGRVAALGAGAAALTTAALRGALTRAEPNEAAAGKVYLPLLGVPNPVALLTLAPGITMQMQPVGAGEFVMGSDRAKDPQADSDELPQHRVTLPEYWIGKTEVTVAQFAVFVRATGYAGAPDALRSGKDNHPVNNVSWDDAQAFCRWASGVVGQTMRLPSEAEWEKAARGPANGTGADRRYLWGEAAPDPSRANYGSNVGDTTVVGQYSPQGDSPYGCADMAGNVWEWTNSLYRPYPYNAADGRENSSDSGGRVVRGGSFYGYGVGLPCAARGNRNPSDRDFDLGFRLLASSISLTLAL